jgi:hypothetical protein
MKRFLLIAAASVVAFTLTAAGMAVCIWSGNPVRGSLLEAKVFISLALACTAAFAAGAWVRETTEDRK